MDPVGDARALVSARFPDARAAVLGGGILSAHRTVSSDLDIVVLSDRDSAPYRESVRWRGWPAELFVQRPEEIGAWFAKDTARRRPTLARMCAGGVILFDDDGAGARVVAQAKEVLAAGPPAPGRAELDALRYALSYALTDLFDDLTGSQDPGETVVICWTTLTRTAELAC